MLAARQLAWQQCVATKPLQQEPPALTTTCGKAAGHALAVHVCGLAVPTASSLGQWSSAVARIGLQRVRLRCPLAATAYMYA
jgi:hypothetical protein